MACRYEEMKYKFKPKHEQICPVCGKTFWPTTANKQIYCSASCGDVARGRNKSSPEKERTGKCIYCGQNFTYKWHGHSQLYCSKQCSGAYNRRRKAIQKGIYRPKPAAVLTPEQIAKLPTSPPGPVRVIPIGSAEPPKEPAPHAKIRIPVGRMPYRGVPTRDRANDVQRLLPVGEMP